MYRTVDDDHEEEEIGFPIETIQRLDADLRAAARILKPGEARYLVSLYYEMQEQRIRAAAQFREAGKREEPNALVTWMMNNYLTLENDIKRAMDAYSMSRTDGRWLRSIIGIGPVLAAGLMAHIDITRAHTPANIWSFAGLNPQAQWSKGQKRPWNADLKVLCWKIGQSFVKSSSNPKSFYGPIYLARKAYELSNDNLEAIEDSSPRAYQAVRQGEPGLYAPQAKQILETKKIGADTFARQWYEQGILPPAHIQSRAERYVVKLFLSHYWNVLWDVTYGDTPGMIKPAPYPIAHLNHAHYIAAPNWPPE